MYLGQRYNKMRKEESESVKNFSFTLVFLMVSCRSDALRPSEFQAAFLVIAESSPRGLRPNSRSRG